MNDQTQAAPPAPPSKAVAVAKGMQQFKVQLDTRVPEIARALPAHIKPERFARVVMTAVQNNVDLLNTDRQSLFNACMRAAADGLLPDGREGAIVSYRTKVKGDDGRDEYRDLAQWMPMIFGLRKKARNSGELSGINAHIVYREDEFDYWVDENGQHLKYKPADAPDISRDNIRLVFAWARTKDGELFLERMTVADIEKVRSISRAKNGPAWSQWWEEMAKKTVVRRLSKVLPMSSDLDDLIRQDDDLYNVAELPKERAPALLDLSASDAVKNDGRLSASDGGGKALDADTVDASGGNDDPPPPSQPANDKPAIDPNPPRSAVDVRSQLESEIANTLADCKTHPDCDAVSKLFQKEIADADARTRAQIIILIEDRKAEISRAAEADFPGDR